MTIATCGHKVEEGISCSVDDGELGMYSDGKVVKLTTYGTYCAKCILMYYNENLLENNELKELIELVKAGN